MVSGRTVTSLLSFYSLLILNLIKYGKLKLHTIIIRKTHIHEIQKDAHKNTTEEIKASNNTKFQ